LVLESDLWSVPWLLFCHRLLGSGISVAWTFSRSSVMALCLLLAVIQIWRFSCCVMKHLECLHEFRLEVYPAANWMRWQQRIPIQDWSFAGNDGGFGQCNIVSSCWVYSRFIPHEELPEVSEAVIFRKRDWFKFWWPWCCLQPYG
jgi:hypothetical protein